MTISLVPYVLLKIYGIKYAYGDLQAPSRWTRISLIASLLDPMAKPGTGISAADLIAVLEWLREEIVEKSIGGLTGA